MMGFGYVLMRLLVFNLVDEVQDMGNFLLVKKGDEEGRAGFPLQHRQYQLHGRAAPARGPSRCASPAASAANSAFSPLSPFSDFRKSFRLQEFGRRRPDPARRCGAAEARG